ncbi:hypothetical protein [Acidithiobacillus albertensis]|nr:hypothetical protein [Acidithiobacillus albertensis]
MKDKKMSDISKNAQIIDYMPLAKKMAIPGGFKFEVQHRCLTA